MTPAGGGTADAPRYTLDEGRLPPVNRFQASDLDTSVNACHDFNAYANGKWLAANEIPGDRTSWGSFEMLTERTLEAQRQLAEQAAANESATGVEKIVGDFWATGMDRESIDAKGIAPIQDVIDAIDALDGPEAIAAWLREGTAEGRNMLFRSAPRRLQDSRSISPTPPRAGWACRHDLLFRGNARRQAGRL